MFSSEILESGIMGRLPYITIQSGTFNSNLALWKQVLESVKSQDYPKDRIEHIVFDKGSTNGSVELSRSYGCRVVIRNDPPHLQQVSAAIGILRARGSLVLVLESDNILTSRQWLKRMVQPFLENPRVVCAFSAHNSYYKYMSLNTRYTALIGSPDPTLYYLQKTEKIPMTQKRYAHGTIVEEKREYWVVRFDEQTLPTLGDNGHMFRKSALLKVVKDPEKYTHTDAFMDLLILGYDTYAVVKNSIIHIMNPNILAHVARRVDVKRLYYDERRGKRSYLVYNPNSQIDRVRLATYIVYSLTFIQPFVVALIGFTRKADPAWFLHPVMCFLMMVGYGWSEIVFLLKRRGIIGRRL